MSGWRTIESSGGRTGVVFIVCISTKYSIVTDSLNRDTSLIVGNGCRIVGGELSSVCNNSISKNTGVLDDADIREEILSGTRSRSGSC